MDTTLHTETFQVLDRHGVHTLRALLHGYATQVDENASGHCRGEVGRQFVTLHVLMAVVGDCPNFTAVNQSPVIAGRQAQQHVLNGEGALTGRVAPVGPFEVPRV